MKERGLFKIGAAGGLIFVILQMVAQGMIQSGGAEPAFTAASEEIMGFFQTRNQTLATLGGYVSALSFLPFIWFLGALRHWLSEHAGSSEWIADVALGSGLLAVFPSLIGAWELALFRLGEGLDPQIARLAFDLGNYGFAATWVMLGGMLLAAGGLLLSTAETRSRLGWFSLIVGVGLLAARLVWVSQIAFIPYVLYWLWLVVMSITLMRAPGEAAVPSPESG